MRSRRQYAFEIVIDANLKTSELKSHQWIHQISVHIELWVRVEPVIRSVKLEWKMQCAVVCMCDVGHHRTELQWRVWKSVEHEQMRVGSVHCTHGTYPITPYTRKIYVSFSQFMLIRNVCQQHFPQFFTLCLWRTRSRSIGLSIDPLLSLHIHLFRFANISFTMPRSFVQSFFSMLFFCSCCWCCGFRLFKRLLGRPFTLHCSFTRPIGRESEKERDRLNKKKQQQKPLMSIKNLILKHSTGGSEALFMLPVKLQKKISINHKNSRSHKYILLILTYTDILQRINRRKERKAYTVKQKNAEKKTEATVCVHYKWSSWREINIPKTIVFAKRRRERERDWQLEGRAKKEQEQTSAK